MENFAHGHANGSFIINCWAVELSKKIPSLQEWRQKVYYMFLMAKLTAISKVSIGNARAMLIFQKQWCVFQDFNKLELNRIQKINVLELL